MTSKFLDYTGLSYLWGKIKEWCSSIFVTKATDEDITGTKTFLGSKKIAFKQSGANDKLGFTLYNNSSKEQGYLEYNPTNKIANVPLFTLGNYATATNELSYIGFRRYSNISGASGAYNLLVPLVSDAKTPFNLTTTYTNFYLPLGISDGTNIVTASNSGVINISSLLPTIPDTSTFLTSSSTLDATKLSGTIPSTCYTDTNTTYTAGSGLSLTGTEFSLDSHNQASNTINLMTGYSKPSSGSAINISDSLNSAIGKLEARVDAVDDSNYVHKTGNEIIAGIKTFSSDIYSHGNFFKLHQDVIKGTNPDSGCWWTWGAYDKNGANWTANCIGMFEVNLGANGVVNTYLRAMKNTVNVENNAMLGCAYNSTNDIAWAYAPSTLSSRTEGTDIVTRDWIPQDTRIVHTSGNESIGGTKTFTSTPYSTGSYYVKRSDIQRTVYPNTAVEFPAVGIYDKNGSNIGFVYYRYKPDKSSQISLIAYSSQTTDQTQAYFNLSKEGNTINAIYCNAEWWSIDQINYELHTRGGTGHSFFLSGTNTFDGASIQLYGRSHANYAGSWYLRASTMSSSSSGGNEKILSGTASGSLYWAGSAIQYGSDRNIKNSINNVDTDILDIWDNVEWDQFKYNESVDEKGDKARLHIGLIAQDVKKVFEDNNLDICKYGILCHEQREASDTEMPIDLWTIRYTEAAAMEAAYQRRKNKILENRISELEKQVSDMLILLQNLTNSNG